MVRGSPSSCHGDGAANSADLSTAADPLAELRPYRQTMRDGLKVVGVLAGGAGLAGLLAWLAFVAWLSGFDLFGPLNAPIGGWHLLGAALIVLVHFLWILVWCRWRAAGRARFICAGLLLPAALCLGTWCVLQGWTMSTNDSTGWASGAQRLEMPRDSLVDAEFLTIVGLLAAMAILVLFTTVAPGGGSGRVHTAAVLGSALCAIPVVIYGALLIISLSHIG